MNKIAPKISVVMSVYNGSRYLRESIESILNQSFNDFEFIIIDDCSTDNSWEIITEYSEQDERIVLIKNKENIGLTKSLNKGLKIAQGEYIARIDADDVSYCDRLAVQVEFMDSNESIALISTYAQYIDASGKELWIHRPPEDPIMLKWEFIFRNPIRHSTVMWRSSLIASKVGDYNSQYTYAQDYELWSRINRNFQIFTLPITTVAIRHHQDAISLSKVESQDKLANLVTLMEVEQYLKRKLTESEARDVRLMSRHKHNLQYEQFKSLSLQRFKDAIQLYLSLCKCFSLQILSNAYSSDSQKKLFQEIELDLLSLISFTKRERWLGQAVAIIIQYTFMNPVRAYPFLLFSLRELLPTKILLSYRSIRQKINFMAPINT